METFPRVLYLIDISSYFYRAFHALPPLANTRGLPTNAAYGVTTMLLKVLRERQPQHLALVFDAKGPTFRHELYKEYKAHRPPMPEALVTQLPFTVAGGLATANGRIRRDAIWARYAKRLEYLYESRTGAGADALL
jgi:5'-3' exonuclease